MIRVPGSCDHTKAFVRAVSAMSKISGRQGLSAGKNNSGRPTSATVQQAEEASVSSSSAVGPPWWQKPGNGRSLGCSCGVVSQANQTQSGVVMCAPGIAVGMTARMVARVSTECGDSCGITQILLL
ncbi:MAG: hypothetical protein R2874_15280 [Desulfobacterales bacterium]